MKNLVREYLLDRKKRGLPLYDELISRYAITIKRHPKYNNLVLFKYNQINSPMGSEIVQQCRGLILDEDKDFAVVCWPFNKFFNYGESNAAEIDWASAKVYEKLDGSCMNLWFYNNEWHVSTNGSPDASGSLPYKKDQTFASLFWQIFDRCPYGHHPYGDIEEMLGCFNESMTYMFEMCSPYNQIIVKHDKPSLTLIGMRSNICGEEYDDLVDLKPLSIPVDSSTDMQWRTYDLASEDVLNSANKLNPWEQEGYVVVDKYFNRIKVKSPQYVVLHHNISNMTKSKLVEIMQLGELPEVLANLPEWRDVGWQLNEQFMTLKSQITGFYKTIEHHVVQKDFALEATKKPWSAILFEMRKRPDFDLDWALRHIKPEYLENWLETI